MENTESASKPVVSIITPVYNTASYLLRCIDSVLAQTYKNIEVILIDDGSTDGSGRICDDYARKYQNVIVCHIPNGGASLARRKGLELCRGEYVVFVDSDDVVEPDYIEQLWKAMQKHNTQIAACSMIKHKEGEAVVIDKQRDSSLLGYTELHERFFHYEFWGSGGKIYLKSLFDDVYFPEATVNEDYAVMAQLFHKCKRMAFVDIPLYHYLMHEGSLSNQTLSQRMMEEWTNKLWCYNYYKEHSPAWLKHAEAQTAETCCKLIAAIGKEKTYRKEKAEMQSFLRQHFFSLLANKHLVLGLKCMLLLRIA